MNPQTTDGARAFLMARRGDQSRADDAWARIQEKPASIVITRIDDDLPEQTVRVEASNATSRGAEAAGQAARSSSNTAIVFGIKGHRTLPDTNIQRDDRFKWNGTHYRVTSVTVTLGEVQATCEAQQ